MSTRGSRYRDLQRSYARAGVAGMPGVLSPCAVPSDAVVDPLVKDAQVETFVSRPLWIDPPVNWENIDQAGYASLPAIGSTTTIITFTVLPGRNGIINLIANNFVGGGWVEGTGDIVWRILVDGTPPPGATSYNNIVNSLGSPASPTRISGFRIFENQVITLVAFNNPGGPNGGVIVAGQLVGGRLAGYLYPRELEQGDIWV